MAIRIPWDKFEACLLLEYWLKVENGTILRQDAVSELSRILRERAIKNGIRIDDFFRNENGIKMQMTIISATFCGENCGLHGAPKVFEDVVGLYKTNYSEFEKILHSEDYLNSQETFVDGILVDEKETIVTRYETDKKEGKGKGTRISDVLLGNYSDFLSYCNEAGKYLVSELTNVDFVAYRSLSGSSREYVEEIKSKLIDDDSNLSVTNKELCAIGLENNKNKTEPELESMLHLPSKSLSSKKNNTEERTDIKAIQSSNSKVKNNISQTKKTENSLPPNSFIIDNIFGQSNRQRPLANILVIERSNFVDANLEVLHLSKRSLNRLYSQKLWTISDVLKKSVDDLFAIDNLGIKSITEIVKKIVAYVFPQNKLSLEIEQIFEKENRQRTLANLLEVDLSNFVDANLEVLHLSQRAINRLNFHNYHTISDVLKKSVDDLFAIKNLGIKSITEIVEKIASYVDSLNEFPSESFIQSRRSLNPQEVKNFDKGLVDAQFISTVQLLLAKEEYSTDDLSDKQEELFNDLKTAVETVGEEICLQAFMHPDYGKQIYNMFNETFAVNFSAFEKSERVLKLAEKVPENLRGKLVMPFMLVYCTSTNASLNNFLKTCTEESTISDFLNTLKKKCMQDNIQGMIDSIISFLIWLNFDFTKIINNIWEAMEPTSKSAIRALNVFNLRYDGKTFDEIASNYNVTRSRIQQIEKKFYLRFWRVYSQLKYDPLLLIYALENGKSVINYEDIFEHMGKCAFALWECLKHNFNDADVIYKYSKELNAIVFNFEIKKDATKEALSSANQMILNLDALIEKNHKTPIIKEISQNYALAENIVEDIFDKEYQLSGDIYHRNKLTTATICEYILKNYFPNGYKIANELEVKNFRRIVNEVFGNEVLKVADTAIERNISQIGLLCDKGRYIHPDFIQVDKKIIDEVNKYIESSPQKFVSYGEIFSELQDTFAGTQITNKYILQGVLKKYGCKFYTGKDFVRKGKDANLLNELEDFIEERGTVHKSEIFSEFSSLSEAGLAQTVSRTENILNIDNGFYIHVSQFNISDSDYTIIRDYLTENCQKAPQNIRVIYANLISDFPEFLQKNNINDTRKLFAILKYMFKDEFSFSKPYVAMKGMKDLSNRAVLLQYIGTVNKIDIDSLVEICEDNGIKYGSSKNLFYLLTPEFIRVEKNILMRSDCAGVTNDTLTETIKLIKEMLVTRKFLLASGIDDFMWFPKLNVNWNEFVVESLTRQSDDLSFIFLNGDPCERSLIVFVSDEYKGLDLQSFIIKILKEEVQKGAFSSKVDMNNWLKENGLITATPKFLEGTEYFYVNETGVHCTDEQRF